MDRLKTLILRLQNFYLLCLRSLASAFRPPLYLRDTLEQMDYAGAGSLLIVFLITLFVGMALSLSIAVELTPMGLELYTGRMMGITVIRELGPITVAISFAGRAGSGMASEIGSMVLGQQVDVLRVFGVDPIKKLVVPRVISSLVMLPALTVIGDLVALIGGYYISVIIIQQSGPFYWSQVAKLATWENILPGLLKPVVFGYLIACISCFMGLETSGGAKGLRRSTTNAVVTSIVVVIVTDFMLARFIYFAMGRTT